MLRRGPAAVVLVLALTSACGFTFDRALGAQSGEVAGTISKGGAPAAYARLVVDGSGYAQTARGDGSFLIRGLIAGGYHLSLSDDENGDGLPERAASRTFVLRSLEHAGETGARLSGLSLGDIALVPVARLDGAVRAEDGPVGGAVVVAVREALVLGALGPTALGAEAATGSFHDGRFSFRALAAGKVALVAFAEVGGVPHASAPREVLLRAGAVVDESEPLELAPLEGTRAVTLVLAGAGGALVQVLLRAPGAIVDDGDFTFDAADPLVVPATERLTLELPFGVFDVHVASGGGSRGVLFQRVVHGGDAPIAWGPLRLVEGDPCEVVRGDVVVRDCDRDDLAALPSYAVVDADEVLALWRACAEQCALAFGSVAQQRSCEVEGAVYDCDDDGDGQPDVTEPSACLSPGAGTDADGDGLCDASDPFPQCAENDDEAAACGPERSDERARPPVRPELSLTPPPVDGGVDAGDAGAPASDDAGDAGPVVDDAGGDAGPLDAGASEADAGYRDDGGAADGGDDDGGSDAGAAEMRDLHVQLVWDTNFADLGVSVRPTGAALCSSQSCWWQTCAGGAATPPDWSCDGTRGAGDPRLDLDDTNGFGPENITVQGLLPGGYDITVDVYESVTQGLPSNATVRVYVDGVQVFEDTRQLGSAGDVWEVARLDYDGVDVTVTPLDLLTPAASCGTGGVVEEAPPCAADGGP